MKRRYFTTLSIMLFLVACSGAEDVDLSSINDDRMAWEGKPIVVHGEVIEPKGYKRYISVGSGRYFVITDGKERLNVWYDTTKLQCPPYPGSRVTVEGKIKPAGEQAKLIFMGRSLNIESAVEPPEGTVRLCSLGFEESKIYAREGVEGLQQYWQRQGHPVKAVTNL